MLEAKKILVVDDSRIMRELLTALLGPHCPGILTAGGCRKALETVDANRDLELIVCDVTLPDGDGFEILEHVASLSDPRPRFILISARWAEGDAARAAALGAIGYLPKPICLRDLRACEAGLRNRHQVEPKRQRRTLAKAWLLDSAERGRPLLCWEVHDVSMDGALMETRGPLPIGTKLEFELVLGGASVRARGTVVRVQEPSWVGVGGVAVSFDRIDEASRSVLGQFVGAVDAAGPDGSRP